ncbi:alpha/beta hydrolase [Phormidium tenue FACHB-886]|nr:alpha/beta hydrolase [Phormidium tenue FACHB-886]
MASLPELLWLNVSPSLQRFDRPLLQALAPDFTIKQWEYSQTQDEATSLDTALVLLHDYLKQRDRPIHLMGHGISGLLAWLYTQRYPKRVRSLALLSVGVHPAIDWQAFYYVHCQLLPCDRQMILAQMVHTLFGYQSQCMTRSLIKILEQDLITSLSPHTLFRRICVSPERSQVPTLFCGGEKDSVVSSHELQGWQNWMEAGDQIWQCPHGRYFFHHRYPDLVRNRILDFYGSLSAQRSANCSVLSTKV